MQRKEKIFLIIAVFIGIFSLVVLNLFGEPPIGGSVGVPYPEGIHLIEFKLSDSSISLGDQTFLHFRILNNEGETKLITIEIEHNPKLNIQGSGLNYDDGVSTIEFGEVPPGREVGQILTISGELGEWVGASQYNINMIVYADASEVATKSLRLEIFRD